MVAANRRISPPRVDGFETPGEIIGRLALEVQRREQRSRFAGVNWMAMLAVLVLVIDAGTWWIAAQGGFYIPAQGGDFTAYRDAAASWLHGTGFYYPFELTGPFHIFGHPYPILYPPNAIPLFAAFTVLPGFLWWAIPLGIIGWRVSRVRGWKLLLILGLALWPTTLMMVQTGNPGMWIVAFLCLDLSPLVLLKPTLAPFALVGAGRGRWWTTLGVLAIVSLFFWREWLDWLTVVRNGDGGILYSLNAVPSMLIPIVAGELRSPGSSTSTRRRSGLRWAMPARRMSWPWRGPT